MIADDRKAVEELSELLNKLEDMVFEQVEAFLGADATSSSNITRGIFEAKFVENQVDNYHGLAKLLVNCRSTCERATGKTNLLEQMIILAEHLGDQTIPSKDIFTEEDEPEDYVFRRKRIELLYRAWLMSYYCGLKHDRLLDSALRIIDHVGAIPSGVSNTIASGNILEETRHRIAVLNWVPRREKTAVLIVSDTPLITLDSCSVPFEKQYRKHVLAEFYFCLQIWLMSNAIQRRNVDVLSQGQNDSLWQRFRRSMREFFMATGKQQSLVAYYYSRNENCTFLDERIKFAPEFRIVPQSLVTKVVGPELEKQRICIPPGVYGDDIGIMHFTPNSEKWKLNGLDYMNPYSSRFVTPREIIQFIKTFDEFVDPAS